MAEENKIEMEDDQGNVMSAKTYSDLRAQGIIQITANSVPNQFLGFISSARRKRSCLDHKAGFLICALSTIVSVFPSLRLSPSRRLDLAR